MIWLFRIRIRIGKADPESRSIEIDKNEQINPVSFPAFQKDLVYLRRYRMFWTFYLLKVCSSCKMSPFVTLKSDEDQDPFGYR